MRWLIALLFLTGVAFAQSQTETQQKPQQAPATQNTSSESDQKIVIPAPRPIAPSADHPAAAATKKSDKTSNAKPKGTEYFSPLFGYTLKITDALLAAFTFFLVIVGFFQACYLGKATTHFQIVERAYVKMSHRPPGVMFNPNGLDVRLGLKNNGTTPARVTNALANFRILANGETLPLPPSYQIPDREPVRAFLVKDDEVFFTEFSVITLEDVRAMSDGATLCVFGYVDYVDAFGKRQRGGYARVYLPDADGNNLGFVTQDGYNYDRPRVQGEGADWG